MELSGAGKSPMSNLSFRYNANNEELEELFNACDDDPPTPQFDLPPAQSENASPKRGDRTPSIIDKYFKSIRSEKVVEKEKVEDVKATDSKTTDKEETRSSTPKEASSSPMKEYLNRLGKRGTPEVSEVKESSNETWKIFHEFKFKIAQAVEDMKTKSLEETREKSVPRENSTSDSEENSAVKDVDQQSVGDTDNQVSSLHSSIQNLSEITQPITAKAADKEVSLPTDNKNSESSDDTHKNLAHNDMAEDYLSDSLMDVESGVEALEDAVEGFGDVNNDPAIIESEKPTEPSLTQPPSMLTNYGIPPSETNLKENTIETKPKTSILNLTMFILTIFLIINVFLFPKANIWNGFLMGICFFYFASHLKEWFMDNFFTVDGEHQRERSFFQVKRSSAMPLTYTIPSVKEHTPLKKYDGWINHYRFPDYDPFTYHINKTTTSFMKLEGCNLRISYTKTKVGKRALWDEKIENIVFYQHRLYNITGARVLLLPDGLVKRRLWSKKYPICIILNEKEKIQILEKESANTERKTSEVVVDKSKKEHETESTETSTSPEKKKKFVWRRKEKSVPVPHTEVEPGKEGLRHRLVRKMHREDDNIEEDDEDKKADTVSTFTEPVCESPSHSPEKMVQFDEAVPDEDLAAKSTTSKEEVEEELDEAEMSRIKDLMEETDVEPGADSPLEGEWTIHVKHSKDKQCLFFFARTGREKHEWYRRFVTAILDASESADSSAAEDKSSSDQPKQTPDNKDGIELAVYRAEKDAVALKTPNKSSETIPDSATATPPSPPVHQKAENYEKNFWPFLLKIIQSHEKSFKQSSEVGVMCQIEPTPHDRSRNKKKKKNDTKPASPECGCRMLPSEVTWLNTVVARIMFDVMRDPVLISRVQARIQKKLHTLKLPSFMSPLAVTALSLAGAVPLLERVAAAAADARGVWLDADLRYDGGAYIALQTQINLMKLKEKNMTLEDQLLASSEFVVENEIASPSFSDRQMKRKPAVYDDEVEDSAESSSDDETPPVQPVDSAAHLPLSESTTAVKSTTTEGGSSKKKFLRMVDKIATNKYFQQVTDYKYVKRAMEGLSNTDIKLHLEIHGLEGRLALNLPPPPHDRLWIGFRTNPQLVLKARPAVGARTLRFAHISNWIEQKLSKEFEKVLVLPNMEDFIIDVMTPTPVQFE